MDASLFHDCSFDDELNIIFLLYALSQSNVPHVSIPEEDLVSMRARLGLSDAYETPRQDAREPSTTLPLPPPPPPPSTALPPLSPVLPPPPSPASYRAGLSVEPRTPEPIPGPSSFPAPPSTRAHNKPFVLTPVQGAPSARALGKRRAEPRAATDMPPAKRTRGEAPVPVGDVTCGWEGCDEKVYKGDVLDHVQTKHFPGVSSRHAVKTPQQCRYTGCQSPTSKVGKEGYAGLTGLFKHLRDAHYHIKHVQCPYCGTEARDDAMRRHKEVCRSNPKWKEEEKENKDGGERDGDGSA
ncbi:hypothetical protein FKP32DRAFT_1674126 [Trametes sanguinea]|nr:hypothetical protein FKP32DRAFT_1674126 [Trametes sanguinea]